MYKRQAGNCIVLKPSQLAPVSAYVLSEAAEEIGLPPGVINIVTGRGEQVGTLLSKHEDVDMVSFTGSTPVSYTHLDVYKRQVLPNDDFIKI